MVNRVIDGTFAKPLCIVDVCPEQMEFFNAFSPIPWGSEAWRLGGPLQNLLPRSAILTGIPDFSPDLEGVAHHARRNSPKMPQPGIDAVNLVPRRAFLGRRKPC